MKIIHGMLFVLGIVTISSCQEKEDSSKIFAKATVLSINEKEGKFDLLVERDTAHYEIKDVLYSKLPNYNEEIMLILTDTKIINWYRLSTSGTPLLRDTIPKQEPGPFVKTPPTKKSSGTKYRPKPPRF